MDDKSILRRNFDCQFRTDLYNSGNMRSNVEPRAKCFSHLEKRTSKNIFKNLFSSKKIACRRRSNSYDRCKKSSKFIPNSISVNFLPPRSLTLDPMMLSQYTIPRSGTPSLLHFSNHRVAERSDALRSIFKWDILDEDMILMLDKNPFLNELHHFLCSEKFYVLELLKRCSAYSDPLRKFSSLGSQERSSLFQDFECICEKLAQKCQQIKIAINRFLASHTHPEALEILTVTRYFFSQELCHDLSSYASQIPHIEKLHARLLRNDEYRDFIAIVEERNLPLLNCLQLPLKRTTIYSETLRNLLPVIHRQTLPSSSSSSSTCQSTSVAAILLLTRNLVDVQSYLAEMSAGINTSLDWLQKLFPNDDLMLGIPVQNSQRTTLPEPIKRYKLTYKKKKPVHNSSVPSFSQIQFSPDRNLLLCSSVQLHKNLNTSFTLFLLTDLFIIAKGCIRDFNLELKDRVDISQIWLKDIPDDAKNSSQSSADSSLVIGWPLVNMTLTFETVGLRNRWRDSLLKQIALEKVKEVVKYIFIKVEAKMADATMCKMIQVRNDETSSNVVQRLLKELRIENREVNDFQLWVAQEPDEASFELMGHEFPFCIQLQELKHSCKDPQDKMAITERRPLFILRDKRKARANSDEQLRVAAAKSKRKKLKNIFKKTKHSTPSKFFGQNLSAIFIDGYPPQNLKRMLERLFEIGPYCNGVFRKSANHAKLKQITSQLDSGLEVDFSDVPVIMIANIMKKFLRSLPDCLLMSHLYLQWLEVAKETEEAIVVALCKKQYGRLLPFNQSILLDLMCILRRIEENSHFSTMTANSLAICIGPSLLWAPRVNNSSNGSNNSLGGGGGRRNNDADDEVDLVACASKSDSKLNSVSHDAEDVNKVIETLIKHASKIFGDERYSALSRSFESNSLRLKPLTDIRDASTDAESAVSSEAHEDKSHFSSMCTVDDLTDFVSGDEKFSSIEGNPQSAFEHFAKKDENGLDPISDESKSDEDVQKSRAANKRGSKSCKSKSSPVHKSGDVYLSLLSQSPNAPPRLVRQSRLVEDSFEVASNADDYLPKLESGINRHKESISAAFANIARKLIEDNRKKETNSSDELLHEEIDHSILRKSNSLYDASSDQGESKFGLLQRRGMTEKGEDVFPKQIVHSLPKKNLSLISLNDDNSPVNMQSMQPKFNSLNSSQCASFENQSAPQNSFHSSVDSHLHDQKSSLWSTGNHQKVNKNVLFGRRLPTKTNLPLIGCYLKCSPNVGLNRPLRLPPPSYEEATEYLRRRNFSDLPSLTSSTDISLSPKTTIKNTDQLIARDYSNSRQVSVDSNSDDSFAFRRKANIDKENVRLIQSPGQKSGVLVNFVKSPTIRPTYPLKYPYALKRKESLKEQESTKNKPVRESEEWDKEVNKNSKQGEKMLTFNAQRRRRKPKRHSDPRLSKSNRKSCRNINRSRSDVADTFHKVQQQKVNIPDLLADLKKSGVLVELNKNSRISAENVERHSPYHNLKTPPSSEDLGHVSQSEPLSRNKDWRIRLAKHFREVEERGQQDNNLEGSNCEKSGEVHSENCIQTIPSSIVGNCRQKFERLNSLTSEPTQKKADKEKPNPNEFSSSSLSPFPAASSSNFLSPLPKFSRSTTTSSSIPITICAKNKNESHSVPQTSHMFPSSSVEDDKFSPSKFSNFERIKSLFDKSAPPRGWKSSDKTTSTANAINIGSTTVDAKSNVHFVDLTSSSSPSKQILSVGRPIVMNFSLTPSLESKSTHHPASTPAFIASEIFRTKTTRDDIENLPWSVSELKKLYAGKNNIGPGKKDSDLLKRQSLPSEAARRKHQA